MDNYKFYTPIGVADQLLSMLPREDYKSIVDICCGSWNLLRAAKKKYPDATFTGVDIDKESEKHCFSGASFYWGDGREFALDQMDLCKTYDLILSNPPFGYLKDHDRKFASMADEYIILGLNNKRYENEMIQANLLLADYNSTLIFIVPSTFVEGKSNKKVRRSIASKCQILKIIKLPSDTFGSKHINTYALIMKKRLASEHFGSEFCKMTLENKKYKILVIKQLSYLKVEGGDWIDFINVSSINVKSYRGNISSNHFTKKGKKILHCSSVFDGIYWVPSIAYCDNQELLNKCRKAKPGDIIINRIGKCAGYWTVNKEEVYISDCILVFSAGNKKALLERFEEISQKRKLNILIKGVCARYISALDIKTLL